MQFFNFIFLARSWASDRLYLVKQLALVGRKAQEHDTPLTFILYPEGTVVSPNTRPISKKYADRLGIVSSPSPAAVLHSPSFHSLT
jgi:lysocardiolipin and lysophospholipid acyltransferase